MGWQDRPYNREDDQARSPMLRRLGSRSVVTWLLIINVAVLIWDSIFAPSSRGAWLALDQYFYFSIDKAVWGFQVWRWFTYQFVHGGFLHLLFNMIALYFFGPMMESWWGARRFLVFYLLCGMFGAVLSVLMSLVPGLISQSGGLVGASGAVFGVLVGCAVVAPREEVRLIFPPVTLQMRTMVLFFLGMAVIKVLVDHANAGGEAAHLGGALLGFGLVRYPWLLNWADRFSGERWHQKSLERSQRRKQKEAKAIEALDAEVDRILIKVKDQGLMSLTAKEKRTLQQATDMQKRGG